MTDDNNNVVPGELSWRNPITGSVGCCASAASGHAAAAPPRCALDPHTMK